ncbi:hypothetical protein N8I84_03050 [Streptomyces cynarae]|uniref:Uncharacterized protein n=1 Tax=Streptomyces cynarae TaxID=2981134 RepID=A0ABY6DTX3_9ACTN|nr:hypothetical protein [Streptomyces cynarae]UXY17824.1 hypothetical protein N8I84_03050 [Streptomyces cynarae]
MRTNLSPAEGTENPVRQVRLSLSTRTLTTVADLLCAQWSENGTNASGTWRR